MQVSFKAATAPLLNNGEILEDYPDDLRGESCLILGYAEGRPIHVVCGYTSTRSIRVITVYLPNLQNGAMRGRDKRKEHTMHDYGDCSFCGGEVKEQVVELDYRYKERLYVFREVPAGVCQQCGEKYLVATTAKAIEHEIRTKKEWSETVSVPVTTFSKIAESEA